MENSQKPGGGKDLKQAYRTAYLIAGFLKQTLTEEEKIELDEWILASDEHMILFEKMTDEKNLAQADEWFKKMNVEEGLQKTKRKIEAHKPKRFWQYAVAAAVAILIGIGIYIYIQSGHRKQSPDVAIKANDISPGSNRATLQLDNGTVILLDSLSRDSVINNQIQILQKQGEVIYSDIHPSNSVLFNILTIPRGGHYKLTLPDGTVAWLNSESSIRFPAAFAGSERKVFVTGETFFHVAKDKAKPFRVVANGTTIEALGTQFDINAYMNEPFTSVTLVEGSVRVAKGGNENMLKPGQQAQINDGNFQIVDAEINDVTAWKDNMFKFTNTPLETIMRQIERWYDANVEYQEKVNLHLNAKIDRDVPVSRLLQILEQTNQVHFKIEGKKIIVMK